MADTQKHRTAAEIRQDAETLKQFRELHQNFEQRPDLAIFAHQAMAMYELAAQFARFAEIVAIVTHEQVEEETRAIARDMGQSHMSATSVGGVTVTPLSPDLARQLGEQLTQSTVGTASTDAAEGQTDAAPKQAGEQQG